MSQPEIRRTIEALGVKLGVGNPANFLKDIIRGKNANERWPASLSAQRIAARQRFRQNRVLEFVPFLDGYDVPFPDRFEPTAETPVFDVQSISLPSAARRLGREDETWLTQVMVNLRIVEAQLAFQSREFGSRLRDIVHLQIGMKTQPEIDATFVLTAAPRPEKAPGHDEHVFVTCEVKRKDERLLEDQIRFQVHQGFKETSRLLDPRIDGVKPIAIRIVTRAVGEAVERLIYVVEFATVRREDYETTWKPTRASKKTRTPEDDTPVYGIPLERVSDAYFRVRPAVKGVS